MNWIQEDRDPLSTREPFKLALHHQDKVAAEAVVRPQDRSGGLQRFRLLRGRDDAS